MARPVPILRRATPPLTRVLRLRRLRDEAGQTTAEYALVILGAAAIGALLLAWARGSGAIGDLFDEVVSKIL
jgi:Flp pilus assembly pilin Flp